MIRKILVPLLLIAHTGYAQLKPAAIPVDGYAAIVNGKVITVSDVMNMVRPYERQMKAQYKGEELQEKIIEAFRDAREALIEQKLIITDFENSKGELPDRVVDQRIDEIIADRFHGSRTEFLKALEEERITLEEWRNDVRDQLIVTILRRQEVTSKINISPSEVREAYLSNTNAFFSPEKVKIRMIVIPVGNMVVDSNTASSANAALELTGKIREEFEAGGDFSDLAKKYSTGSKADAGGDWGWIKPSTLNEQLALVVSGLSKGELSKPVEIGTDYHLVLLEDREEASYVPFEGVKDEIEETLRREEGERLYKNWVDRLRNKYTVKVY